MLTALRVEVNVIAVFILLLLLITGRHKEKDMLDGRLYRLLLFVTLLYAVVDTISWVIDGKTGETMLFFLNLINVLCFLFCIILPYVWLLYAEYRLFEDEKALRKLNLFLIPTIIIYGLIVITTPITGWFFSFDNENTYSRGPLFLVQVVLTLVYTLFPTFRAFQRLKMATTDYERRECYIIGGFVAFPLVGLLIQVFFYGMPIGIISTVVAELMVFINVQNKQISLDALTGINNRGQLNRYLSAQVKKEFRQKKTYLLILDIDHFKTINDTYGHKAGDQAIVDMSKILQLIGKKNGGFLARYGGDEFAIVIERESQVEIDQYISDIMTELEYFNQNAGRQYKLAVSIGCALFGTDLTPTVDKLIEAADGQMYQMKEKKRQAVN